MRREMPEILASQGKMLERSGQPRGLVSDAVMSAKFSIHLRKIGLFLEQSGIEVLEVKYAEVVAETAQQSARVNDFLGGTLDQAKMIQVVDNSLYRQRG